ncbi:MAG: helix-turn-helix transcriptional regulator [Alistipes sp.]|nr:helix-turn-helix transcriptional regulator [Alistipes sp.]
MNRSNCALTEAVYYILLVLTEPMHGYGIMQRIAEISNGRLLISAGTLYGALSSLLDKQWIIQHAFDTESRKKEYQITPLGREVLQAEYMRLAELVANGEQILK